MTAIRRVVARSADAAKAQCAQAIVEHLAKADSPSLVLAGGSTPQGTYDLLAVKHRMAIDWERVQFWFGDERCVGPDHPKSNYGMARASLFDPLGIPADHVHRMLGELGPDQGAERYERLLDPFLGFTVVLLGMGPEGHTASLFPNSPGLKAEGLVVGAQVPTPPPRRITMTPRALSGADHVFLLVTGAEKAPALSAALGASPNDPSAPTSFVRGRVETVLFSDEAASGDIPDSD